MHHLIQSVKLKALAVFLSIHVGVGFLLYSLLQMFPHEPYYFKLVFTGTVLVYGGLAMGLTFVYLPLAPWIHRYHAMKNWRMWVLREWPTIIALIPLVAGLVHLLRLGWKEVRDLHHKGRLDFDSLTDVLKKFGRQTESAIHGHAAPRKAKRKSRSQQSKKAA